VPDPFQISHSIEGGRNGIMNTIVTGAAGFIGSNLSEKLLVSGHRVIGIDSFLDYYPRQVKESNLAKLKKIPGFEFREKDILQADWKSLLEGTEAVFHLAAQAGVRASWSKNFVVYTKNNIEATQLILEEAKNFPLKKFVFASTSSVYGDTEDIPMKEVSLVKPVSPYGVTKLAAEELCYLYWKSYGVPCVSLRYFTVYGPGQRPDMAFYRFLLAQLEGRSITIFEDGNQTRDFTYIDDIVSGTILASQKGKEGETYNLGGGSRITVNEVLKILGEITGKVPEIRFSEKQKGDMRHTFASTERARQDLGYTPRVSLREGLKNEYEWLRDLHEKKLTVRFD
jgi:nucleoside-diphosphate-sugar epimerase